jgi:hypothetical protein
VTNSEHYIRLILKPLLISLLKKREAYGHFMQDSAMVHAAYNSKDELTDIFGE